MTSDACSGLVSLAERLARTETRPHGFVRELAREGAGIRTGPLALVDLARGGRNPVRGGGFRTEYSDGSGLQVRHFCGVARATTLIGPTATRWLMVHVGHDRLDSADGRLTEAAIEMVALLRAGRLPLESAAGWIDRQVCA
jgi:hypothetical protein